MNSNSNHSGTTLPYEVHSAPEGVLNDHALDIILPTIVFTRLPLNFLGIITNTINIRVFLKQGVMNDNTNIGFASLSFFDLMSSICLVPYSLCYVAKYSYLIDVPRRRTCIAFATQFFHPFLIFQQSSAWTTVYMSLVRSLCVAIPLRVKILFTPKKTIVTIVLIVVFFMSELGTYLPHTNIVWVYAIEFNTSVAHFLDTPTGQEILYYKTIITNQFIPGAAIIIVTITTSLMVHKLLEVKKWRQNNATVYVNESKGFDTPSGKKPLASKDIELVKSVTTIAIIFNICLLMGYIPGTLMVLLPGFNHSGINSNFLRVIFQFRFLFDAINASINFFFYIRISSRYKMAFASFFPLCSNADMK